MNGYINQQQADAERGELEYQALQALE